MAMRAKSPSDEQERILAETERSVLGAMMIDRDAIGTVSSILRAQDFASPQHQALYRAMLEVHAHGDTPDILTVSAEMQKAHTLDGAGGINEVPKILRSIANGIATGAHAETHARTVLAASRTRQQKAILAAALAATEEPGYDPGQGAGRVIQSLTERAQALDVISADDLAGEVIADLDRPRQPIRTGVASLDRALEWVRRDGVLQISAEPGIGKTAMGVQLIREEAEREGWALAFSAEMGRVAIGHRMMAATNGYDPRIDPRKWDEMQARASAIALERLAGLGKHFWIDGTPGIDVDLLVQRAHHIDQRVRVYQRERGVEEVGLTMILVDYLQTLEVRGLKGENFAQQISEAGRALTGMARRLEARTIVISSLAKDGSTYYGGQADFQADVRLRLERDKDDPEHIRIEMPKARDSEWGYLDVHFDGKRYLYRDYERGSEPPPMREPGEDSTTWRPAGRGKGR